MSHDTSKTERFSTAGPGDTASIPVREAEELPALCLEMLQASATLESREASSRLGDGLRDFGIVLVDLTRMSIPQLGSDELSEILTGRFVERVCQQVFSDPRLLQEHFRPFGEGGFEGGFYSFPLNSPVGGVRSASTENRHEGIPHSLVWNHAASNSVRVPGLERTQNELDQVVLVYEHALDTIIGALSVHFDDRYSYLRNLVGRRHQANHIKMIKSSGPAQSTTSPTALSGMVSRHRAHVDHCVVTINPPSVPVSEIGGRFYYLSRSAEQRAWRPLHVPAGSIALFGGVDLHAFTKGTANEMPGLVHQVLASRDEVMESRSSLLYRLTPDPLSGSFRRLDGTPFSFHGVETSTGRHYYAELQKHRVGY